MCNLEWSTNIYNQQHAWDNDLKTKKLTTLDVKLIKNHINEGLSNMEISKKFNVNPSTISNIRTGNTWKRIKSYKTKKEEND